MFRHSNWGRWIALVFVVIVSAPGAHSGVRGTIAGRIVARHLSTALRRSLTWRVSMTACRAMVPAGARVAGVLSLAGKAASRIIQLGNDQ